MTLWSLTLLILIAVVIVGTIAIDRSSVELRGPGRIAWRAVQVLAALRVLAAIAGWLFDEQRRGSWTLWIIIAVAVLGTLSSLVAKKTLDLSLIHI